MLRHAATVALALLPAACIPMPERNLQLGTTREEARAALQLMRDQPRPLNHPVLVLNGYHGLPTLANRVTRKLRALTSDNRNDFLAISYTLSTNIDSISDDVVREVEQRWPSSDPLLTTEVDVVAISMGGIVARWAALPPAERLRSGTDKPAAFSSPKRLNINRLFTLGTPHRGATLAEYIRIDSAAVDLRAGSPLLSTLDARPQTYTLICYAQLRDLIVGATRSSPASQVPIWTSGTFFFSHLDMPDNPIFLADIARYLRGEDQTLIPRDPPLSN